jgi:hypothetical protein
MKDKLLSLYSHVKVHIGKSESIEKKFEQSEAKPYLLDDIFMELCYIINNSEYKELAVSLSIRDFPFGEVNRELLDLLYKYYTENKPSKVEDPADIFPECCRIFSQCNTTFLQPSDEIITKKNLPKNAKVISSNVPNCKNMIFNIRPILDEKYIEAKYPNLSYNTGVNSAILNRFAFMETYQLDKPKDNIIIDSLENIYQQLDDDSYRQLLNSNSFGKDYNLINYNLFIVNWENKRIMAMRSKHLQPKNSTDAGVAIGKIKNNIYGEKKMRVADAIFSAYYNPNISDNDVLQIGISAQMYQEKMPRGIRFEDFNKYFNEKDISANII